MTTNEELDELGRSDLHYRAAAGDVLAVNEIILSGADVNLADLRLWTPLHFAAQSCSAQTVSALIEAGAFIDAKDEHGNSPLWRAVFCCQNQGGDVIALLRQVGADPYAKNGAGISPLDLAWAIGNYDVRQYFADLSESGE